MHSVTTTVMAQMLYREKHGHSNESMSDLCLLGKVGGFNPEHLRGGDMLKIRRAQLLPLLPLFTTLIPVSSTYKKKAKKHGYTTNLQHFEMGWFDPIDISLRDLEVPGKLQHAIDNGHAIVRPVAKSYHDGKNCRESPSFTFDGKSKFIVPL